MLGYLVLFFRTKKTTKIGGETTNKAPKIPLLATYGHDDQMMK